MTKHELMEQARAAYAGLNESERFGVPFGMFPISMQAKAADLGVSDREWATALMDAATEAAARTPGHTRKLRS